MAGGTVSLPGFTGLLDVNGRATASLLIPPVPGVGALTLHHAFVVIDPVTGLPTAVSNALPLRITP